MKTIGLLGGMSRESSLEYYRIINQTVKEKLGGLHSAKCLMYSVDFQQIEELQHTGDRDQAGQVLAQAAVGLEKGGADCVVICTNTMHKVTPIIEQHISIPILHIADATAETIKQTGITKVGLLGTKFTMEQDFYKNRLIEKHGLEVVVPNDAERETVHNIIYQELCLGIIKSESKSAYLEIIDNLTSQGAQAIILGCTEIGLLIQQSDTNTLLYDTTRIHALGAVGWALE